MDYLDAEAVARVLAAKRAELDTEMRALERPAAEPGQAVQFGKRAGDHTSVPGEQLTRASAYRRLSKLRAEVDRAQAKLAADSYGRCDSCCSPIAEERLAALPWATRCVACAGSASRPG